MTTTTQAAPAVALDAALAECERAIIDAADKLAVTPPDWRAALLAGHIRHWATERRRLLAEAGRLLAGGGGARGARIGEGGR